MTILTGALIYMAVTSAFLLFFKHVRSCDESMRAAFLETLAAKGLSQKRTPLVHRAS